MNIKEEINVLEVDLTTIPPSHYVGLYSAKDMPPGYSELVEAAPALLELAKEVIRVLEPVHGREADNRIRIELAPLLRRAKEVVAKAEPTS